MQDRRIQMKKIRFLWILPVLACLLLSGCADANIPADAANPSVKESLAVPITTQVESSSAESSALEQSSADAKESASVQEGSEPIGLKRFLKTALLPLGETAYIWGGGWNEEDTGAGTEARTLGVSPRWKEFSKDLPANYNHKKYRYQIHDGLDCSGFVGWAIYNTLETENGMEGYVYKSTDVATTLASLGLGEFTPAKSVTDWKPGDIASMSGHVWICLGTCEDGSVLVLHSSPPGVRLCGIAASSKATAAIQLAAEYMERYYPDWYSRFPDCESPKTYLQKSSQMRWNEETFPDAKEIQSMTPQALLQLLYAE